MLAGKVTPAETVTIRDKGNFIRGEPAAQIVVMTFQPNNGANIPAVKDLHRGSVGNFVESVTYWPPSGEYAESAENHSFRTDLLVLDIRGGDPLADTGMEHPGEVLIFNRDGRIEVINELKDAAMFERSVVPEIEDDMKMRSRDREREDDRGEGRKGGRGRRNSVDTGSELINEERSDRGGAGRRGGR